MFEHMSLKNSLRWFPVNDFCSKACITLGENYKMSRAIHNNNIINSNYKNKFKIAIKLNILIIL